MKILIVDDSLLDRKLLSNILNKAGFDNEIIQADNGEAALEILKNEHDNICVIFLDWQMPVMDGIEFMKEVKKEPSLAAVPIIMISATGGEESKKYAREINPDLAGYLVKPYTSLTLQEIASSYIK